MKSLKREREEGEREREIGRLRESEWERVSV
jgi:hypothetical protein